MLLAPTVSATGSALTLQSKSESNWTELVRMSPQLGVTACAFCTPKAISTATRVTASSTVSFLFLLFSFLFRFHQCDVKASREGTCPPLKASYWHFLESHFHGSPPWIEGNKRPTMEKLMQPIRTILLFWAGLSGSTRIRARNVPGQCLTKRLSIVDE